MKLGDIDVKDPTSFLFKGPWGHGKTLAAASFAKLGPIWFGYWDKKRPIEILTYFNKIGRKDLIERVDFDLYDSHNAGEYLEKLMKLSKDCRYVAVVTDSLTNLSSGAVNWSLAFRGGKGNAAALTKDSITPSWDEYKVETSLVSQALDISRAIPAHIIWTAHPVPGTRVEGTGASMKVTKVNSIVAYGSKVAGTVPGNFTEIYHFGKENTWDQSTGKASIRYKISTESIGDEFAKTALPLPKEFDITDKLFYEVWSDLLKEAPSGAQT